MRVASAQLADIPAWLDLAAEVEPLFGPMVNDPGFHASLRKNIERGSAFCVREHDGPPGARLMGGLLLSRCPVKHKYEIGWLAVAGEFQRHGVGRALMEYVFEQVESPSEVVLLTFGPDVVGGLPARKFYEKFGFEPAEPGPVNSGGVATQVYRRQVGRTPTVRAVVQCRDRYLLVQHDPSRPDLAGTWGLPGGRIASDDSNREATVRRELREELGIEVEVQGYVGTYPGPERLHHVFHARARSTEVRIDQEEIVAHAWFTASEVSALEAAGKLFTGFEAEAIVASQQLVANL